MDGFGLFILVALIVVGLVIWKAAGDDTRARANAVPPPLPAGAPSTDATGQQSVAARREKVSSFVGVGCLVQAIGLLSPFLGYWIGGAMGGLSVAVIGGLLGLVALIVLFVVGSRQAVTYRCGACKNPIASNAVKVCPVCRAHLS